MILKSNIKELSERRASCHAIRLSSSHLLSSGLSSSSTNTLARRYFLRKHESIRGSCKSVYTGAASHALSQVAAIQVYHTLVV